MGAAGGCGVEGIRVSGVRRRAWGGVMRDLCMSGQISCYVAEMGNRSNPLQESLAHKKTPIPLEPP